MRLKGTSNDNSCEKFSEQLEHSLTTLAEIIHPLTYETSYTYLVVQIVLQRGCLGTSGVGNLSILLLALLQSSSRTIVPFMQGKLSPHATLSY